MLQQNADRRPQLIFFTADTFNNLLVKDDIASMEHPVFSLSTRTNSHVFRYDNNGVSIAISSSSLYGLPTIHDKDVLLYCGSLLMEQINKGIVPPKTIRFTAHNFLVTTNRHTNDRSYKRLTRALERLTGCMITTDIRTNGRRQREGFHIIDKYRVIEKNHVNSRMVKLEVTLSDWFYNSLIGKEVFTINRDYFQLRKPLERRLYEIARKHCGSQTHFKIGLDKLRKKAGYISPLKTFRFNLKKTIKINQLPDYNISLIENDIVRFSQKNTISVTPQDSKIEHATTDTVNFNIRPDTVERVRDLVQQHNITRKSGESGYDFYALYEDYIYQLKTGKFAPVDVNAALYGFIKKKLGIESKN